MSQPGSWLLLLRWRKSWCHDGSICSDGIRCCNGSRCGWMLWWKGPLTPPNAPLAVSCCCYNKLQPFAALHCSTTYHLSEQQMSFSEFTVGPLWSLLQQLLWNIIQICCPFNSRRGVANMSACWMNTICNLDKYILISTNIHLNNFGQLNLGIIFNFRNVKKITKRKPILSMGGLVASILVSLIIYFLKIRQLGLLQFWISTGLGFPSLLEQSICEP